MNVICVFLWVHALPAFIEWWQGRVTSGQGYPACRKGNADLRARMLDVPRKGGVQLSPPVIISKVTIQGWGGGVQQGAKARPKG